MGIGINLAVSIVTAFNSNPSDAEVVKYIQGKEISKNEVTIAINKEKEETLGNVFKAMNEEVKKNASTEEVVINPENIKKLKEFIIDIQALSIVSMTSTIVMQVRLKEDIEKEENIELKEDMEERYKLNNNILFELNKLVKNCNDLIIKLNNSDISEKELIEVKNTVDEYFENFTKEVEKLVRNSAVYQNVKDVYVEKLKILRKKVNKKRLE